MNEKRYETTANVKVGLSRSDAAYLLRGAFADLGTQLEVYRDDVEGEDALLCDGDLVAKQLFDGGTALLIEGDLPEDVDEAESWELTVEMLMYGVRKYLESGGFAVLDEGIIDVSSLDMGDMSVILLCAILGKLPWEEDA